MIGSVLHDFRRPLYWINIALWRDHDPQYPP